MQYLRNVDTKIYPCLVNLWETEEKSSFILLLTELKLFVEDMFNKKDVDKDNQDFEVLKSKDKNVIHAIFYCFSFSFFFFVSKRYLVQTFASVKDFS